MPGGCGERLYLHDYFFYVTNLLEGNTEIAKDRKGRILEFIKVHQTPNKNPKTDLNILLGIYQKWLKIFLGLSQNQVNNQFWVVSFLYGILISSSNKY